VTAGRIAILPAAVRRAIVAHARRDAPHECCGLLVGRRAQVMFSLPMANVDPKPRTGFQVDPAEHVAARRVLRRLVPALEIVGVYHSHPAGPPKPSPRDIAESHYPEWLFVIVGKGASVRAYRIGRSAVRPVALRAAAPRTRQRRRRTR
jgi:proteasome lid subunit RPN8/RPN11